MHRPRIDLASVRWLFVKTIPSRTCERLQTAALPAEGVGCQAAGCCAPARPVYAEADGAVEGWLCAEHAVSAGYCNHCGVHIADDPTEQATWAFYGRCQACTEQLFS